MASSKTRAKNNRPAAARSARTTAAVAATPTNQGKPASPAPARAAKSAPVPPAPPEDQAPPVTAGPPLWLQIVSLVLAILGLAISAYETYAHFNGSHLAGCSAKAGGTFDCTAVITSPQSMVFNVIPVAILGVVFYVFAIVIFSPWAWRLEDVRLFGPVHIRRRDVSLVRLGSMIVGMGFAVYLIYAEIVQIGQACEYCSGVHLVTFLLFCITVFSVALWGLGPRPAK
jgi:uncharacterized membrane protein